jgi:hypothetical protein
MRFYIRKITYIILIDGLLRPLSDFELVDPDLNLFSQFCLFIQGTVGKRGRKGELRSVSLNVKVSEVERLHFIELVGVKYLNVVVNLNWGG